MAPAIQVYRRAAAAGSLQDTHEDAHDQKLADLSLK
jgi:hypothetical protein